MLRIESSVTFRSSDQGFVKMMIDYLLLTLLLGDEMRLASAHATWRMRLAASVRAKLSTCVDVLSLVRHLHVVERLLAIVLRQSSVDFG